MKSTISTPVTIPLNVPELMRFPSMPLLRGDAEPLQVRDQGIHLRLTLDDFGGAVDLGVGVRHADDTQCAHLYRQLGGIELLIREPRVGGHVRFRYDIAWIAEMH